MTKTPPLPAGNGLPAAAGLPIKLAPPSTPAACLYKTRWFKEEKAADDDRGTRQDAFCWRRRMLVKRWPLLVGDDWYFVGFKPAEWGKALQYKGETTNGG